ncbi:ATP-binding protein [Sphingobacterium deserti]|uniref:histidine kinase n=1 Tax=Sphingobacterium deserti TaxID=1229276 RepID=A0A0B8SYP5_9SPHI|nr:ATP-binding protein [Sphingobacterium deserti]KGE12477.1 PAS/PAC sensor signal transduction histidine kinase [Sphingobacterium deserti]
MNVSFNGLLHVISEMPNAVAVYDSEDLNIAIANKNMLKIWSRTDNLDGQRLGDIFPEYIEQGFEGLLRNVWKTGEAFSGEEVLANILIDGILSPRYFDFEYKPLKDQNGVTYALLHTATDVTDRKLAREQVAERQASEENIREELQAMNEELATLNEEYMTTNEQLEEYNHAINEINTKLTQTNKNLGTANKEYKTSNDRLNIANDHLIHNVGELKSINDAIQDLNNRLADSEQGFQNLIAQAPVAILLTKGEDFIIEKINSTMLNILGRDQSIIGKPLFEQIPELNGQLAGDLLKETFEYGESREEISSPVKLLRGGQLREGFFNFNFTPFIEDGKVTGVIDVAVEVTAQVLAIRDREETIRQKAELEETLRNSEKRLQGILETMAEGVGIVDHTGQLVYANPMAQQILGLTLSDIEDRTYNDPRWQNLRLDGSPLPHQEHPMTIMMTTGNRVFDMEIGVQPPHGDRQYISINAAPIFDEGGKLTGGIGTFMDVTSRRMILQGKDDFISIASHELKNPVTSLKASLQLLERAHDRLPEESRSKLISQALSSLGNLSRLIHDLLDTSRLEQGQMKMDRSIVLINDLFTECCAHIASDSEQHITLSGEKMLSVYADSQQIGQVLVNFISNAIKYAPDSKEIVVDVTQISSEETKISVKDSGPGIPKEKLSHLFERYYRTNYEGKKFTGLGLGLYISAEIIKNHGGRIGVESELGKGSEFWFTLPTQASHQQNIS